MKVHPKEVTTTEVLSLTCNPNVRIVDIRPVEAYNGWQLQNEISGGHIKGAKSLPFKWSRYMDWIEVVRHKEIFPGHEIVVYGYGEAEIREVAERFLNSGYSHISVYLHFQDEWSASPDLPMEKLERFTNLVAAGGVNELLSGKKPAHCNNTRFKVIHANYRNRDAYLSGHIPADIDCAD